MDQAGKLTEGIIDELARIQGLGPRDLTKGDEFGLPRLIPAGNGETIQITKAIDQSITELARTLRQTRPVTIKNVRDEEWRAWVRSAIGPALMQIRLSDPRDAAAASVLSKVEVELDASLAGLPPREYAFGTTLFATPDMTPFTIGPVTFERREDWLSRKLADGSISDVIHRRVSRAWSGSKLKRRKKNIDYFREQDIFEALGSSPFVCSVHVTGYSAEAGRELALSAARLSLTCVSLVWERSSGVLDGFNLQFDGGVRRERTLRFIPGRITLQGSRIRGLPHGPKISKEDWGNELTTHSSFFSAAGEALDYLLGADGKVARPALMNALMQSLLWFYEGCREDNDLLSVVDFAASLDALGGGKKAKGILQVLGAPHWGRGYEPHLRGRTNA